MVQVMVQMANEANQDRLGILLGPEGGSVGYPLGTPRLPCAALDRRTRVPARF